MAGEECKNIWQSSDGGNRNVRVGQMQRQNADAHTENAGWGQEGENMKS